VEAIASAKGHAGSECEDLAASFPMNRATLRELEDRMILARPVAFGYNAPE
jgi:hypothetical protein